jgi:uncharacterized glyoxalase superfamily protein PhnB
MQVRRIIPELMVDDVKMTVDYYVSVLGFKLTNSVGNDKMVWANVMWGENEAGLMFMEREALIEDIKAFEGLKVGGSVVLFIEANGIDELYEKIKTKAEIVQEKHTTFYGTKEFVIKDCNGYILAFAERLDNGKSN